MSNEQYKARIAATFLARSQSSAFLTEHVSYLGVFVRTDSPPPVMELLRIEFVLPPESTRIVMHGMVTKLVRPTSKHGAPGVEIAFFAKSGESGALWDQFIQHVRDKHPESRERPVMLAQGATDQVRRAHPRQMPSGQISVASSDSNGKLVIGDISRGGMFLMTDEAFAIGTDLRVTLSNPAASAQLPLDCVVRRRAFGSKAGVGLEFRNMTDESRAKLMEFVSPAGDEESVEAHCYEVFTPRAQETMSTRGFSSAAPRDSWASLDEGWPRT